MTTAPAPPSNLDAERACLGSLLMDRDAVIAVAPWLTPEHFYLERHRWVYSAVLSCYGQRIPPDAITVAEELRKAGHDDVCPFAYLLDLANVVPTSMHVEYYGRIVEQTALSRDMIQAGAEIATLGYQPDIDEAIERARERLDRATRRQVATLQPIGEGIDGELDRIASGIAPGHPTGLIDLDQKLGGLQPDYLLILAARPSIGKSSLALQIAYKVARDGRLALFLSYEMKRAIVQKRLLAMLTGIDLGALMQNRAADSQLLPLAEAAERLKALPNLRVEDTAAPTITDIRALCNRVQAEQGPIGVVVVDYLQLIPVVKNKTGNNRAIEVGEISRGLKLLAMGLGCPVLALSQLNRASEARTDHRPQLADLRESGNLEQDADVVLFIYRDEMYNAQTDAKGIAEVNIAKNRNGPLGMVRLGFHAPSQRWRDLERYRTPEGYA